MSQQNQLMTVLLRAATTKARSLNEPYFDFFHQGVPMPWHVPWRSGALEIIKDQELFANLRIRNEVLRVSAMGGWR